jgi:prepilin-type processing-associated H-X9-DG protein
LNPYVDAHEAWHCPADRGLAYHGQPIDKPSNYEHGGNSYRFNWYLFGDYQNGGIAEDANYNLAGKRESWVVEPSSFIAMHEFSTFPWPDGVAQWHYSAHPGDMFNPAELKKDSDKLVANICFVDGHSEMINFTPTFQANPTRMLEPGKNYTWYKQAH